MKNSAILSLIVLICFAGPVYAQAATADADYNRNDRSEVISNGHKAEGSPASSTESAPSSSKETKGKASNVIEGIKGIERQGKSGTTNENEKKMLDKLDEIENGKSP